MVLLVAVLPESPRVVIFAIAGAPPSAGKDAAEHGLGLFGFACWASSGPDEERGRAEEKGPGLRKGKWFSLFLKIQLVLNLCKFISKYLMMLNS